MVLITFVTLSAALFAQTCTVHLYYSGANSTATLQSYLNNPAKPALYNLDAGTKQSLLKYTFFLNGVLGGFTPDADVNITNLYKGNYLSVISAICNCNVVQGVDPDAPLTYTVVATNNPSDPPACMQHFNDRYKSSYSGCCKETGKGCDDIIVPIGTNPKCQ